jgi:hypothetical protein
MKRFLRRLSLAFAAGAVGGLANSVALWAAGHWGLTAMLGVRIAPGLSAGWLYPRLVWGGLWGALLLLPIALRRPLVRAFLISLGPTLAQLLWFFPRTTPHGWLGLGLGAMTPLVVTLANLVWGLAAVAWFRQTE